MVTFETKNVFKPNLCHPAYWKQPQLQNIGSYMCIIKKIDELYFKYIIKDEGLPQENNLDELHTWLS